MEKTNQEKLNGWERDVIEKYGIDLEEVSRINEAKKESQFKCDTKKELNHYLERHLYVKDRLGFVEKLQRAEVYSNVRKMQETDSVPDVSEFELAERYGVSPSVMHKYLKGEVDHELARTLRANENARQLHESRLAPESADHRIDPSQVYEGFRHLREEKEFDSEELAKAISLIYKRSGLDSKIQFAELYPYHQYGPTWLKKVSKTIESNREKIEVRVNEHLDFNEQKRMRLGLVNNRLYMRVDSQDKDFWRNVYDGQSLFVSSKARKEELLQDMERRLDLNRTAFGKLVGQLTDFEEAYDNIRHKNTHLNEKVIGLGLELQGKKLADIESGIKRIGLRRTAGDIGGIHSPKFTDEKSAKVTFSKILGAGLSDAHLDERRAFTYTESDKDRIEIFKGIVKELGEVHYKERVDKNGVTRLWYTPALGKALERQGMPVGDKAIQNSGLSKIVTGGGIHEKSGYIGQMIAQDGNPNLGTKGDETFQWYRSIALYDIKKGVKYLQTSEVTSEQLDLVQKHGTFKEEFGSFGPRTDLSKGKLDEIMNSHVKIDANQATNLIGLAQSTIPKLMNDEVEILRDMGVESTPNLAGLTLHHKSGRLSARWIAQTNTVEDAMRLALLAPPDDIRKRKQVDEWISSRHRLREKVEQKLKKEGYM